MICGKNYDLFKIKFMDLCLMLFSNRSYGRKVLNVCIVYFSVCIINY